MPKIEDFAALIPKHLLDRSGAVFYAGRLAFSARADLYLLGLNPGGCPKKLARNTILAHTDQVLNHAESHWSEYRDESWDGATPGTKGLAPRVLHLLKALGQDVERVPASNLVFARTQREACLAGQKWELAEACWPLHAAVIKELRPRVVLCFGKTVGNFVAHKLGATHDAGEWREINRRRWTTRAWSNGETTVVAATHPSIADWRSTAADPSPFVRALLRG